MSNGAGIVRAACGRAAPVAAVALAVLILPGCMITRIHEVRTQLCDGSRQVEVAMDDGLEVSFLNPVILDSDVRFLVGISPFEEDYSANRMTMRYVVENQAHDGSRTLRIPIELSFGAFESSYKLERLTIPIDVALEFDQSQVDQMSAAACLHKPSLFQRQVAIDIDADMIAGLPTREEILSLAGPPSLANSDLSKLQYELAILGSPDDGETALITLEFDESGTNLLRMQSQFLRYSVVADFETARVVARFSI